MNFDFRFWGVRGAPQKGPQKLKFMEPSRVQYQVNLPEPQQFLCPVQKINSFLGTSQEDRATATGNMHKNC